MRIRSLIYRDHAKNEPGSAVIEMTGEEVVILNNIIRKATADLKDLYGWHISDLRIYDRPRKLQELTGLRNTRFGMEPVEITHPPQSWGYVEDGE